MPRGKDNQVPNALSSFRPINVDFSYEERDDINAWIALWKGTPMDLILELLDNSWKASFSFDKRSDTYLASLTFKGKLPKGKTAPVYMLRHDDFVKLVAIVAYFWAVILMSGENMAYDNQPSNSW